MLTTNDARYDHSFRLMRHHGMSISDRERHVSDQVIFEAYLNTGYNYRMTDIQAAIGIEQLKRLPEIIQKRRLLAIVYSEALNGIPELNITCEPDYCRSNWQSYIIRLEDASRQKEVIRKLHQKGVSARRGVMCAHLETPYSNAWPSDCLPHSENAQKSEIIIPLYPAMTEEDIHYVASILRDVMA
jgi:dTDP-4-amino-4,6-dideoxygalactose transaminase